MAERAVEVSVQVDWLQQAKSQLFISAKTPGLLLHKTNVEVPRSNNDDDLMSLWIAIEIQFYSISTIKSKF